MPTFAAWFGKTLLELSVGLTVEVSALHGCALGMAHLTSFVMRGPPWLELKVAPVTFTMLKLQLVKNQMETMTNFGNQNNLHGDAMFQHVFQ